MSTFNLEPLLRQLAEEFGRRGMSDHLGLLRGFYRDHRARRHAAMRAKIQPWTEDLVIEWLATFQIAPFDTFYPVLGRGVPCPSCRLRREEPYVAGVFPGGCKRECRHCGARWLQLDD